MITKTKDAKQPRTFNEIAASERSAAKPKTAKPDAARRMLPSSNEPPLTDVERDTVFALVWRREPALLEAVRKATSIDAAVGLLKKRLAPTEVSTWVATGRLGEPDLAMAPGGVVVRRGLAVRGVIEWWELAEDARDDDGAHVGLPGGANGVAEESAPAPAKTSRARNGKKPVNSTVAEESPAAPVELATLGLELIDTSKNPRRTFDQAKLDELAESIKQHGILQPIVVNAVGGRPGERPYDLIAGERRLRAAKLAGLAKIVCRVLHVDEAAAAELRLIENLQREDLTAIEEAQGFAELLKQSKGARTHKSLAEKLGVSESYVTNRLRLLKLPDKWQKRILSREMPATHARSLAAYAAHPAILNRVDDEMFNGCWHEDALPVSLKRFDERLETIVEEETCPMTGDVYSLGSAGKVAVFTPTEKQREQLGVITVVTREGKKEQREERATNAKLWEELQQAHEKTLVDKKAKGQTKAAAAAKKLSPAQQKTRHKQLADQLARWIRDWRSDWLREILGRYVFEDEELARKTIVMGLAHGHSVQYQEACVNANLKARSKGTGYAAIAGDDKPQAVLTSVASHWLWNDAQAKSPHARTMPPGAVEALAQAAGIDLAEEWEESLAGELTLPFFNRLPREQLVAVAKGLRLLWARPDGRHQVFVEHAKKTDIVAMLISAPATKEKLPKQIAPVKAPKEETKGAAKKPAKKGRAK